MTFATGRIPHAGSRHYAILFFTTSEFSSVTSHILNWVLFLLWLRLFILSGVTSPLFSSSILAPTDLGSSSFSILSFCLFILFMGSQSKNTEVVCHFLHTQCPRPCSKPPLTNTFTGDTWTLMESLGQSSCGVTAPFSWVLMHTRFCLCPPRVCFPSPV